MTTDLTSSIGAKIFIGAKTSTAATLAAYDALSDWVEIGLVESVPEFGTSWETGGFTPVSDGLKRKFKTVQDNGSLSLSAARKGSDAGQIAARAAADDTQADYPFKVELGDAGTGVGAKPTRSYFRALVTSATLVPGGSGDIVKTTMKLEINSRVFVGDPVAGT